METKYSQNWQKTNHGEKPVFHVNGKRVSLLEGFKLVQDGFYGHVPFLKEWFDENGYVSYEAEKLASNDVVSLVKVRSEILKTLEAFPSAYLLKDSIWHMVAALYIAAGGSNDYLKQRFPGFLGDL